MADDEEIHVEVDETPVAPVIEEPKVETPTEGIEELKRKLAEEQQAHAEAQRARVAAERQVQVETQRAQRATTEVEDTNLHLVNNAIETVKREQDLLKGAYKQALAEGDFDKAADIQMSMTDATVNLRQLENGREALKNRPKIVPVAPPAADPVEQIAAQVTPTSAKWLRANRDSLKSEREIKRMFRAHEDAVDDGIVPDSPAYFEFIETRIGIRRPEPAPVQEEFVSEAAAPVQRRSSPTAAPVSRNGSGTGSRPNVVRLSAEERETADNMGMSLEEYAKNKHALQKEGRLGT